MPSDEMVEKVARAIRKHVHTEIGQDWDGMTYTLTGVEDAAREIAALAAAEAGEPVGWRYPVGPTFAEWSICWAFATSKDEAEKAAVWGGVHPLYASPPSEASRDERAVFPTIERELVACLEADGIECEQVGHAWTADVSKRTELDVTGLAVAIATAIRARGES